MTMKRLILPLLLVICLLAFSTLPAAAQEDQPGLRLSLRRDFGYGGFNNEIQGTFSVSASGPEDLQQVEFLIDGESMAVVTEAPFRYQFNTDWYGLGEHTLTAVGITRSGQSLESQPITAVFVSAEVGTQAALKIVGPLLLVILGVTAIAILPMFFIRSKRGFVLGNYGVAGGAVCPKCRLPYSRRVFSPNMLVGKLERCPHCGKLAIVPAAPPAALAEAEAHYRAQSQAESSVPEESEQDKLRRLLDSSRFED
jgi:hypothetical protein